MASTSSLPRIIYGTAWKKERTKSLVVTAVLQGFRALDTASQPKHYREDLVGEALQELYSVHGVKREDVWMQTKYTPIGGQDPSKGPLPYDPTTPLPTQIRASLATSLSHLHTSYLDSYLLHSPLPTPTENLEAWKTMAQVQDEGKARLIGVCNAYDVGVLEAMGRVRKVQVVQNRWFEGNRWDREVRGYCKREGIMYQSFWTLSGSPTLLAHPTFLSIAEHNGLTPEQTLYKLAQMQGISPLSGTTDVEHMRQDLEVEKTELLEEGLEEEVRAVKDLIGG